MTVLRIVNCNAHIVGWDGEPLKENDPEKVKAQHKLRAEKSPESELIDIERPITLGKFLGGAIGTGPGQIKKRAAQCAALGYVLANEDEVALNPGECRLLLGVIEKLFEQGRILPWTLGVLQYVLDPEAIDPASRARMEEIYGEQGLVRVDEVGESEPRTVTPLRSGKRSNGGAAEPPDAA